MVEIAVRHPAALRDESRLFDIAALALLGLWTLAFGWPLLHREGFDDAFFSEAAHLWTQGAPPYLATFDIKPPGFFALLALAQEAFGPRIETLHGLSLACNVLTAAAIYGLGRLMAAPLAGFAAAATYGPLAAFLLANDAYPPLVALVTVAFWIALLPGDALWRAAFSGLVCGAAVMTKQTAVMESAALLVFFWRAGRLAPAAVFVAAAAVAPLGFFAYFAFEGGAFVFWRDVVVLALQRPEGVERVSLAADSARILLRFSHLGLAVPLAFAGALTARALSPDADKARALVGWLVAAVAGFVLQHGIGLAYLGPVMPPALLLAFLLVERRAQARFLSIAATALLSLAAAFPLRASAVRRPVDRDATARAASIVAAERPRPGDRLLALDFGGWVNVAADLAPPTPYYHRMHLLCRFPGAGLPRLAEAFAARPRFVVVGRYLGRRTECDAGPSGWPIAEAALAADYRELDHVAGETDDLTIYERR